MVMLRPMLTKVFNPRILMPRRAAGGGGHGHDDHHHHGPDNNGGANPLVPPPVFAADEFGRVFGVNLNVYYFHMFLSGAGIVLLYLGQQWENHYHGKKEE